MKTIIMALVITAIAYTGAQAQTKKYTVVEKEVCKTAADKSETCYKNVYYYTNDVYQSEEPTEVIIKKTKGSDDIQYCEKSPRSNIIVCHNTKPGAESPTYYKMCRDDGGYSMYCTPHIPTNSTFPWSNL